MVKLRTYLICRIIFTFIFMISSTYIWFNRKVDVYHEVKTSVVSNEVTFSNLKRLSEGSEIYNLKIENLDDYKKNIRVYIVPDILKNNISNNYIKYQINNNTVKTLNMDGMIMASTIDIKEEKNISLKLWISDTYIGDLNYEGRVVVS